MYVFASRSGKPFGQKPRDKSERCCWCRNLSLHIDKVRHHGRVCHAERPGSSHICVGSAFYMLAACREPGRSRENRSSRWRTIGALNSHRTCAPPFTSPDLGELRNPGGAAINAQPVEFEFPGVQAVQTLLDCIVDTWSVDYDTHSSHGY
jgi:hypothetical protein